MYKILERPAEIAFAMRLWEKQFSKGALKLKGFGGNIFYCRRTGTWGHFGQWSRADGSTRYWNPFGSAMEDFRRNMTVEINPDDRKSARNMQGVFAKDTRERLTLFHRGRMKIPSQGITEEMFDRASGLSRKTLTYTDGSSIDAHVVADLGGEAETVQDRVAAFVEACRRVRIYFESGSSAASEERLIEEAESSTPEPVGTYVIGSRDERLVERRHGEVHRALIAALDGLNLQHTNSRVGRWGPDARTKLPHQLFLFEIKTELTASDLQKAVGQLLLYEGLLKRSYRKVLVLPKEPKKDFLEALTRLSIEVIVYRHSTRNIVFRPTLTALVRS